MSEYKSDLFTQREQDEIKKMVPSIDYRLNTDNVSQIYDTKSLVYEKLDDNYLLISGSTKNVNFPARVKNIISVQMMYDCRYYLDADKTKYHTIRMPLPFILGGTGNYLLQLSTNTSILYAPFGIDNLRLISVIMYEKEQ